MPQEPLLDFDTLVAPIPGDNPAGGLLPFETRQTLDEGRKEINPDDYSPDDPLRPSELKRADWAGIIKLAKETLAGTSKDLSVAARLTEALVKQHGFAGLRDGLILLRRLVDQCWDRLSPPIEDESDLDVRAAAFLWLDDPDRGALFPSSLRAVPMIADDGGSYSWLDWRQSQNGRGRVTREVFEAAIAATPRDRCEVMVADLVQCLQALNELTTDLNAKLGPVAPGLIGLRQAVDDCRVLAHQVLQRKGAEAPAAAVGDSAEDVGSSATTRVATVAGPLATRAEIYQQLAAAAAALKAIEPHSPIPYLLQRAVELGAMPFPDLMKELVRNAEALESMNRELGIKAPPSDES